MKTRKRNLKILLWLPALLLTATDAYAWGLYTHVWFAQSLLWLVPLADNRIRDAARRFPRLVMAGACLPDLALVRDLVRSPRFADSHDWDVAAMQLARARDDNASDEARAIALGYASHLLSDIFAHNHFVPAHENVWADVPVLTHAACEWALDHHVRPQLFATPGEVLTSERAILCAYLQDTFGCAPSEARRLLMALAQGDRLLRAAGLPRLSYAVGKRADKRMVRRFNHYLDQTVKRLPQINGLIEGGRPQWDANPPRHLAHVAIAEASMPELRSRLALPRDVFL